MSVQLTTATATSCLVLQEGDQHAAVQTVQKALNKMQNSGLNGQGYFGAVTKAEVVRFQKTKGLTQDGVVGALTWKALGYSSQPLGASAFGATQLPKLLGDPTEPSSCLGVLRKDSTDEYVEWDTPFDDDYLAPAGWTLVGTVK